jgi:hypothetical protein
MKGRLFTDRSLKNWTKLYLTIFELNNESVFIKKQLLS